MSSINPNQNPQPADPHSRPPLTRQSAKRGLLGHTVVSLDSLRPSLQGPLNSTARRTSEVFQDQFFSNTSEGAGGGGGKATPPSSLTRSAVRLSQSSSTSFIQDQDSLDSDGLDSDGLSTDSEDESKAGSPQPLSTTQNTNSVGINYLSIFYSDDNDKPATPSSKNGGGGASKVGEKFTFPEIPKDEDKYTSSDFAIRGFDREFQTKVKAVLTDFYQSTDPAKNVLSQKEAAKDAEEDFQNRLSSILHIDYDPTKKIEGLHSPQALKQEALNSVNNELLLNLQAKLEKIGGDGLNPIIKKILIQCGYAVVVEGGVYLAAAKPQEFLIFSEAFKEAEKQLDICIDLFAQVKAELSKRGCSEEGIESRLSDFIKGFEFTPRKSLFNKAETKQFINQILAPDLTRREEAKKEARTALISKGMNPKVIDYGIKQLFLTRYKNIFVPALSGPDLAFKVESFIKDQYYKTVLPLARKFGDEGWNLDVALSTINVVMENHFEETSRILEEDGIEGLKKFVDTTVQKEVRAILENVPKAPPPDQRPKG